MQKAADERAIIADNKLAKVEAAQRQIGKQVAELRTAVERDYKKSQTLDRVREQILVAISTRQRVGAEVETVYLFVLL